MRRTALQPQSGVPGPPRPRGATLPVRLLGFVLLSLATLVPGCQALLYAAPGPGIGHGARVFRLPVGAQAHEAAGPPLQRGAGDWSASLHDTDPEGRASGHAR